MSSANIATLPSRYSEIDTSIPLSDIEDLDVRGWRRNDETRSRILNELWGRFNASYNESRQIRQYDWRRNWEFASGNQWIEWNEVVPDWCQMPVPEEMRFTENQFRGTMRQGINMQVQGDPAYDVMAATSDWGAHVSCSVAKPMLYKYARDFGVGRLRVQNIQDAILYGFGVRKMFWQPQGGRVDVAYKIIEDSAEQGGEMSTEEDRPHDEDGVILNKRTGEPLIDDIHYLGKMCMKALSPWDFFPQPGLDDPYIDNMEWCMDTGWVSPAWIARSFPGAARVTLEMLQKQYSMPYQLQQPGDLNWGILGQTQNRRPPQGKVLMQTYYQRPAPVRGFECGLEIKWCGQNLLYVGPLQTCPEKPPYDAPLPFSIYVCDTRRGTFYPRPLASDWVEPQMRINQILSDQFQFADLCLRPNLLTHLGDRAPDEVSFGFNKWEISGAKDPSFLVPPGIPPQLFALKADAQNALDRVAMQFGATRGERSSSDPSGYYLDVLREHDQIDLQAPIRDQAKAEEQCGDILLRLAKKYEPDDQWLEVVGTNGREGLAMFTKDKLDPGKCNIIVQVTSLMPFLAASRKRAGLEVYEKGLLGPPGQVPPEQRRKLIRWMDQPDLYRTLDLEDDDELLASRNHYKIIFEEQIPIPDGMEAGETEGVDPKVAMQIRDMMVKSGKAFIIDDDWDPNPLIEFATERKKKDDWDEWPDRAKGLFDQYMTILKQTQQQMMNMQKQAVLDDMRSKLALQAEFEDSKQESQAKGRAKRDIIAAAAKAAIAPNPGHQARSDAAVEVVKGFAQHLFKWTLAHESGGRAGQPGGREAHE